MHAVEQKQPKSSTKNEAEKHIPKPWGAVLPESPAAQKYGQKLIKRLDALRRKVSEAETALALYRELGAVKGMRTQ